jgi:prevent-host-death family protein
MNMIRPKKRLTVGAREANQNFSHYLKEAEMGAEVVITKNGKEVARLVSFSESVDEEARRALIEKVMKATKKGLPITRGNRRFSRDEMYER